MISGSHTIVFGLGISGQAAAQFLLKMGRPVIAVDKRAALLRSDPKITPLIAQGLKIAGEEVSLDGIAELVVSPGIPRAHPLVQRALAQKIAVMGEIELAFRHMTNRCIGITGSNGKTTTVLLTEHLLNAGGIRAKALGNIGVGLSSYLLHPDPEEVLVIELSSFQLETLCIQRLDWAAVLNLTPNHLDRHPSMADYISAKLSIQKCLKPGGTLFVSKQVQKDYGALLPLCEVFEGDNIQVALTLAKRLGVDADCCARACSSFRKPPHRIEWVADIEGVSYYNDSKSSNLHSVLYALQHLNGPLVLIVGGTDKGSSYRPWVEPFQGKVKHLVAYGAAADKMEAELSQSVSFEKKGPFREAVFAARARAQRGDTVLLSPGCSSYDQFRNFEHRGDVFKEILGSWIEKKPF